MNLEARHKEEYGDRQTEAARRVLVDVAQVLAPYQDCLVVIGGWVPDLLLPAAEEPHVGSIDVDLALDVRRLDDGRYADMVNLLLATRRYVPGAKPFQLVVEVDLQDGHTPIQVEVEFLAPREVKLKKNRPKLLEGFRVLQADACGTAFREPIPLPVEGRMVSGAHNRVLLRVANLADFAVMKAHALAKRDKPKDVYDLCYVFEERRSEIAANWATRMAEADVMAAVGFLREKFQSVDAYGPRQLVAFYNPMDTTEAASLERRAYELVQDFLKRIDAGR